MPNLQQNLHLHTTNAGTPVEETQHTHQCSPICTIHNMPKLLPQLPHKNQTYPTFTILCQTNKPNTMPRRTAKQIPSHATTGNPTRKNAKTTAQKTEKKI
jgi:hypothetical protein